MVMIINMI